MNRIVSRPFDVYSRILFSAFFDGFVRVLTVKVDFSGSRVLFQDEISSTQTMGTRIIELGLQLQALLCKPLEFLPKAELP
jgi:hypothetical protein